MRWQLVTLAAALAACGGNKPARDDAAKGRDAAKVTQAQDAAAADAAVARSEHAAWNAVDNRHAAHRTVEGEVVLDAGDIGFARFIRFGLPAPRWHIGHDIEGERASLADRLASLEVPLTHEQAASTQITMRVHGEAGQAVTVKVNGRKGGPEATVRLFAGWQTIAFPIAKGRLVPGQNQLVLETAGGKTKAALAWLRIGTIHPPGDQDPRTAAKFDAAADAIELDANAGVGWFLTIPDGAELVADVSAACRVEVSARTSDDSFAGGLLTSDEHRLDLSALAGRVARLQLIARQCPHAKISHVRITLHGPAAAPLPAADPPRYVVLWVMDALRADKIGAFTPGARAQTPAFDELAKTGTVFRQYYVQGNESQTSHSSMWTALYPAVHGVRLAGQGGAWKIDSKFDVLASELHDAGYVTTGVTGNGYVNDEGGYTRGFDEFRNLMRETGVENNYIPGQKIVDTALASLDKHRDKPTYLFLGTIDTHGPWVARKPWIDIYSPPPYKGPFQEYGTAKDLGITPTSMGCAIIPPKPDIDRLRAIYDSEVSYHDQQLGRFVKQLQAWGIWDQTLLIVTADHGEEMFEDNRCGHGGSLRDSLLRVPLLVHDPSRFPAGTIVDEGAECVDLMPTVLAALGRPPVAEAQGETLEPLAQGIGRGWPRPSYSSMYEYAHAMRIGRWKARVGYAAVPVINDLVDDPEEMKDVAATHPVERQMLTDNLGLFLALRTQWMKSTWGVVTAVTPAGAAALDAAATP